MSVLQIKRIFIALLVFLLWSTGIVFSQDDLHLKLKGDSVVPLLLQNRLEIYDDSVYLMNMRSFNPYTLSIFWNEPERKYKPFVLDLIYKKPEFKPIVFKPTNFTAEKLKEYQELMRGTQLSEKLMEDFKIDDPIKNAIDKVIFNSPQLVKYNWEKIPEPHRFVDRGYLSTKKAEEDIKRLFESRKDYDTKRKIQKLQRIKTPWVYEGIESVQLSQVFLSNWAKGGQSSMSVLSDLRIKAIYKRDKYTWENYAIHKIGFVGQQETESRINDDLIELNTKFGLNASEKWYYSGFTNFKTQFFNGYSRTDVDKEVPISGFMSPAYLTFAVGMDYKIKEHNFSLMISPLTSTLTMVLDTAKVDPDRYQIPEGKKVLMLNGGSITNTFMWKINEDFLLRSNLSAFYEYFAKTDESKQVHFDWEAILDMKINVWLSARILTHLRYFSNESDNLQFKENLSLSFRYIVRYKR
ncbi:MAG: DUF3078 domain-containing protein [Chlorobi bacterium]|nr:DUF3078 domain-containing protein [Chlorobiota bacterium]